MNIEMALKSRSYTLDLDLVKLSLGILPVAQVPWWFLGMQSIGLYSLKIFYIIPLKAIFS
jgi:hypothetical protein